MEKERRTKVLLLSALVVVVATLSIAFAAMSRTLSINGIGKMDTASWSVYFDNLDYKNNNPEIDKKLKNFNFVGKERLDQLSETKKHQGVIAYAAAYEYSDVEDMFALAEKKGEDPFIILFFCHNH